MLEHRPTFSIKGGGVTSRAEFFREFHAKRPRFPFSAFETRARARHDTEPRTAAERGTALTLSFRRAPRDGAHNLKLLLCAQRWRSARAPLSRNSLLSTAAAAAPPKSRDLRAGPDPVSLTRDTEPTSPKKDSNSKL